VGVCAAHGCQQGSKLGFAGLIQSVGNSTWAATAVTKQVGVYLNQTTSQQFAFLLSCPVHSTSDRPVGGLFSFFQGVVEFGFFPASSSGDWIPQEESQVLAS
jgi:hypothetical protein